MTIDDVIAHYGTKGMKWGVRNDRGHEGERAKTKKIEKLDRKFERGSQSFSTYIDIHNRAADLTNKNDVDRINNKRQYKDADFTRDTPLRQKYYKEHQDAYLDNVAKAASEMGKNASGTRSMAIMENTDGSWNVITVDIKKANSAPQVKHADEAEVLFTVRPRYENGHIVEILPLKDEDEVQHSELMHYGVKGMKWGVRRSREDRLAARRAPSEVKVKEKVSRRGAQDIRVKSKAGRGVTKTAGGRRNMATDDAIKVAASRQKAKSSTLDSLSNKELKSAIERMNMEVQFKKLTKEDKKLSRGKRLADVLVKTAGGIKISDISSTTATAGPPIGPRAITSG